MSAINREQVEAWFAGLPLHDQLLCIERLVRKMRRDAYVDPAEFERQMEKMASDPDMLRAMGMGSGQAP
jgi:hypothetical protein